MSRPFGIVSSLLWKSKKFRSLPNEEAKLFYLYLHSCNHGNSNGCYLLPLDYAASDLQKNVSEIKTLLTDNEKADLIIFEAEEEIVCIKGFFRFNKVKNPKHGKGACNHALQLPDCKAKLYTLQSLVSFEPVRQDTHLYSRVVCAISELEGLYSSDTCIEHVSNTKTETQTNNTLKPKTKRNTFAQQSGAGHPLLNTNIMKRA